MKSPENWLRPLAVMLAMTALTFLPALAAGQAFVPGTGSPLEEVGDDFEDPQWVYQPNLPKVYNNLETTVAQNSPGGVSANGRWYEGSKRGQPDYVRRVATPDGGLFGSTGALAIRSVRTGSSSPTFQQQQDDFIANVAPRVGKIPVSRGPSVVTRVWLPPVDTWENRTGCHFAFRVAVETRESVTEQIPNQRGLFRTVSTKTTNDSWPGMFIQFNSKEGRGATRQQYDHGYIWCKASASGKQIRGPQISTTGWWTMGISLSPDGQVHYYAKPGIEDLTEEDRIASALPFGRHTLRVRNFFFNVCSGDDGRTSSTEFIIDDPTLYVIR